MQLYHTLAREAGEGLKMSDGSVLWIGLKLDIWTITVNRVDRKYDLRRNRIRIEFCLQSDSSLECVCEKGPDRHNPTRKEGKKRQSETKIGMKEKGPFFSQHRVFAE